MDPRPLLNVEELLTWEPPNGRVRPVLADDDVNLPPHPTAVPPIAELRRDHNPKPLPQLLLIHDYQGELPPLCDRIWDGCPTSKGVPLLYTHWWHMDTFCYFGNKLVTIPAPMLTGLAHVHGVAMLGSVMFQNDSGKAALLWLLSARWKMREFVKKLVQIMQTWKFDGYLINIAVLLKEDEVKLLPKFLSELKNAAKAVNPHATILWYDVLAPNGDEAWKLTITNRHTRDLYDAADGIVIKHTAAALNLNQLRRNRGSASVYMNVDVCGRTGEKEGLDSHKTVSEVFGKDFSVALCGSLWAYSRKAAGKEGKFIASIKFWNSLAPVMSTRPIDFFPFRSTFRNGFNEDQTYFRWRDMDMMPHLAHSKGQLYPTNIGLFICTAATHLLFAVKMNTHRNLRIKIKLYNANHKGARMKIKLDKREMHPLEVIEENQALTTMVFRPMTAGAVGEQHLHRDRQTGDLLDLLRSIQ